jgi:RNA-directed DNA polymerase
MSASGERRTPSPEGEGRVFQLLAGLVERARKEARLTNVMGLVDEELLSLALDSLRHDAAAGIDGETWSEYATTRGERIRELHERLRSGRYRAPTIRRVRIPKADGGSRSLGITTIEDRMVQKAVAWVLSAVYEQDFLECSYGFRPGRKAHDALHRITEALDRRGGRWVVEVDIEGYFDTVNHEWLRKFLRHRTNDGGLIRLVGKWLNAGVLDQGVIVRTDEGVPQGGPVSPVLANIYLHYVLDLWFGQEFQRRGRGYAELIRYADDVVAVFANQEEAERFRREVEGRLGDFGLRISPEKTVMVPFDGRNLQGPSGARPKPGGFTFLGFVHYRTKARRGQIVTARKPSAKSRERFLAKIALWLRHNRHQPVRVQRTYLVQALTGHYHYFGLHWCTEGLNRVRWRVQRLWAKWLGRRSQRAKRKTDWETLNRQAWFPLPTPRVVHGWV